MVSFTVIDDDGLPFVPAPRRYKGCMGRIVPGVEFIRGAYPENPELVFSWLLYRYSKASQTQILAFFRAAGDEDFLLSWDDFLFDGGTPSQFGALVMQVRRAGLRPIVFLCSKDGASDLHSIVTQIGPVLPILKACGVPRVCIGWELNSFLSPETLQALIDWIAPYVQAYGAFSYVHFTQGYAAWQPNGLLFADFWKRNVKLLRGVLHQKVMVQTDVEYQTGEGGLRDILLHFNGGSGCPADSGDGTPFDLGAFEVDLEMFSQAQIREREMHRRAQVGVATPSTAGPTGTVSVQGSGCGQ